jgi:Fur family ferric uptake transcriptional regulator
MTSTERPARSSRPTRQTIAVLEVLDSVDGFRSAQDVHALIESHGQQVALATVYRTLQRLADAGEVDTVRAEGGEVTYRRCSERHHHHLLCRGCGATEEIEGPAVERWTRAVAEEHGFVDVSHTLEVFGTCARCRERRTVEP